MSVEAQFSPVKEPTSFLRVKAIRPAVEFGFDTDQLVAVTQNLDVEGSAGQAIYPLPADHSLREGDVAYIIPTRKEFPSGGSVTTFHLIPLIGDRP